MLRVVLWWGSCVEPASGACLKKPFSSLVMVGSHTAHPLSTSSVILEEGFWGTSCFGKGGTEGAENCQAVLCAAAQSPGLCVGK